MQLNKRKSKIVSELLKTNNFLTGQYLANVLMVTSRTIRNDIKELNSLFLSNNISIDSIAGKGYRLSKLNKETIKKIVDLDKSYTIPILPESRVDYIIKQLLLFPKGISVSEISSKLYVSDSTLNRDVEKVNKWFIDKKLLLTKKKGNIFFVEGDEIKIRKIYDDYFAYVDIMKIPNAPTDDMFYNLLIQVRSNIELVLKEENVYLSGDEFKVLVLDIAIAIFRAKNGFCADYYVEENYNKNTSVMRIIQLVNNIERLNDFDNKYIYSFCDKLFFNSSLPGVNIDIQNTIKDILNKISFTFNYDFTENIEAIIGKIIGQSLKIKSSNYSLSSIKKEYPVAFEMAMQFGNAINLKLSMNLGNSTLIDIVFVFACDMEQDMLNKENKSRNVIVICQSGKINNELIKLRLKRFFPSFNILGFYPKYRLIDAIEKEPDIIISTLAIDGIDIPVIVIDPLLKDYDVIKIKTIIRQIEHKESNAYDFMNIFKEELFVKEIEANNQYEIIKHLFDLLKKNGRADEKFLQSVFDRESISSTCIGNMVAVPHAISTNMGENVVAIGITKKPIDWNGEKVQLVFLINIQNATEGNLKQIFNSFFDVISSYGKVERLIKAKNYYEFIKTINQ
jgi:lichenan operon transcriptional antiterminator